MKGQLMVFEQVMLFILGVLIFLVCFASFSSYGDVFTQNGNDDQLEQVTNYIAYSIVRASEGWNGTSSYYDIDIPKTIGGESYRIKLTPAGLNVTTLPSFNYRFSYLYGLNRTVDFSGSGGGSEVTSQTGIVVLYKNGNKIILT